MGENTYQRESAQDGRLLSLEESVRDLSGSAERVEAGQRQLAATVQEGFVKMAEQSASFDKRLKPIEANEDARSKRWGIVKKLILPAVAATMGVCGAKFGNSLIAWLSSLGH
jgi:hypothetical protein